MPQIKVHWEYSANIRRKSPQRMFTSYTRSDLFKMAGLVITYGLLAQLVAKVFGSNSVIGFMLFASGIALAVLALEGFRLLPAMFVGVLLGFASVGEPFSLSLISAVRHVATLFVSVWLLKRSTELDPDLKSLGDTIRIFALAIVFGFVVALAIEIITMASPTLVLGKDTFFQRWSGHTLVTIVVTPLVLIWRKLPKDWAKPERALEAILILGVTFLVGQVVFLDWMHDTLGQIARGYWLYLFITWTAVRLGSHGTVLVLAMVAIQGLVGAAMGLGFFSNDIAKTHLSNYFFYTMTIAAVGLPLATYFTERKLVSKLLEQQRDTLEATVATRTAELATRLEEMSALNKRLEDAQIQLIQSEKMAGLGQLAAGVAHEINNPISFINSNLVTLGSYVESLLVIDAAYNDAQHSLEPSVQRAFDAVNALKASSDHAFMVDDLRQLIKESRDGIERVNTIVRDLKDFARVGLADWAWTDIHQGLESTINIVWNEIKYKATIEREYGSLPQVHCISSQLNQVFMNLLVNAAHAIEGKGVVRVRTGCDDKHVWVEVIDTGIGIPPENLTRIFDPFFTTKALGKGTGLGLSLSWGIVQRHQGTIEVQSTVGKGSTFRVVVPIYVQGDAP
jgi:signal transduction histidine kinase